MDSILAKNKPLEKYSLKELLTLCSNTYEISRNLRDYRRLKKKDLYDKIISENIFEKFMINHNKKLEEEKRKLERDVNSKIHEDEIISKDTDSHYVRKSSIQEIELIYGDYPEMMNVLDMVENEKERIDYIKSEFNLKDTDFKFGNYICLSTYRQTGLLMVGIDGESIVDDFGEYGYELPFSISKHLTDAVFTFQALEFSSYCLNRFDFTVRRYIQGEPPENWTYIYDTYEDRLLVTNGKHRYSQCLFVCEANTRYNVTDIKDYFDIKNN